MNNSDRTLKGILMAIAMLLALLVVRLFLEPTATVSAQSARFDHILIASTGFLYKGQQGMLVLDKRNGNVWIFPRSNETFQDPVFILRLQFEKIDQSPR